MMLPPKRLAFSLLIFLYGTAAYPQCVYPLLLVFFSDSNGVAKRSLPESEFKVYWHVPTQMCRKHKIDFSTVTKYGIIQNKGDSFRGDKIVIMYEPGKFPYLSGSDYVNGGLPHFGNLTHHLDIFAQNVTTYIPDKNFEGLAVIDFERWRPIFSQNLASLDVYREKSMEMVKKQHPNWNDEDIFTEAERRWEAAALPFFEKTLEKARKLRSKAQWGFYEFPLCYNFSPNNQNTNCIDNAESDNDRSKWMYETGNAIYPSVYFNDAGMNETMRAGLIQARVEEGLRIAKKTNLPLYVYTWFKYEDSWDFITKMDMWNNLHVPKKYGANGVIIWGSSKDVATKEKCEQLYEFFEKNIVPVLENLNKSN